MSNNISAQLRSAWSQRAGWSTRPLHVLIEQIRRDMPCASIQWEEDAGEDWLRVMSHGAVIGMFYARAPLAIKSMAWPDQLRETLTPWVVVEVESTAEKALTADARILLEYTDGVSLQELELDPKGFSADHLWWATL